MQSYTGRYAALFLRLGIAMLILSVLSFVLVDRLGPFVPGCVTLLYGLYLKFFPLVRVSLDGLQINSGPLRRRLLVPFESIRGIDETHSKFIRLTTDGGEVRIPTSAFKANERSSLLDDIRLGTKKGRSPATA
jgi:hypothetical protein